MKKLRTERLQLSVMSEDDFNFVIKLEQRPETWHYETDEAPKSSDILKECRWFVEHVNKLPHSGGIKYIVRNKHNARVGIVSLQCNWEKTMEWEIGYAFLSEYWGKGYAIEASIKVVDIAFENLKIHKLMAFVNEDNKKSLILARRLGMVQEGYMRDARLVAGKRSADVPFGLLRSDLNDKTKQDVSFDVLNKV